MVIRSTLAMLAIACSVTGAASAQTPRDASPTTAAGAITGVVLSDDRPARPLRRARVRLAGSETSIARAIVTNEDGTFAFERLSPDEYTITAEKDGYVASNWGATRPGRQGRTIVLSRGETRSITLHLPRGSVITGKVTDAQGQPVPGVRIDVLSDRFVPSAGERRLIPAGLPTATDDRGVYRVFDLPAGDYLVTAHVFPTLARDAVLQVLSAQEVRRALADLQVGGPQAQPGPPKPAPYKPINEPRLSVGFAPVFYPGTVVRSRAVTVTVGAGEQRAGVDFDVQDVPTATVSGTVPVSAGDRIPSVALIPNTDVAEPDSVLVRTVTGDGTFTFTGVPPGRYTVLARGFSRAPGSFDAPTWFVTEIIVDGQDVTGLSLPLQPGLTISGHVAFTGSERRRLTAAQFPLPLVLAMRGIELAPTVRIEADGRFSVEGVVPGTYRLQRMDGLRSPLGRQWLKSAVVNGRDILDAPIELRQNAEDAVVTWSDRVSEISGTVTDSRGTALPGQTVVLFATDRRSWFFNSRRIAAGRTNAQGRYRIINLPAGEYYAVADDDLDEGDWFDPVVLEQVAQRATLVRLEEDERKTLDIAQR